MNVPNAPHKIQRQALPDQLRGFALLGIVMVNMPFLALTNGGFFEADRATPVDTVVAFLIVTLAQGKFYLLFAFLFGYSLTFILADRHADGLRRYRRRLLGLAVLGFLHATLLFIGDILLSYAILGVALIVVVRRSTRTVVLAAAIVYSIGLLVLGGLVLLATAGGVSAGGIVGQPEVLDRAIAGSFVDGAAGRIAALPEALLTQAVLNWASALAMFLLGLAASRVGFLAEPERSRPLWRRLVLVAVTVGLPLAAASAWLQLFVDDPSAVGEIVGLALGFGSAPLLTAGYVGAAALLSRTRPMALFAPAGRMSLTGYLGESVLLAAVFCGWGLGWFGSLSITVAALVALAAWAVLDLFASLWLHRFTHGPVEWVLRCWTPGGVVPLRSRRAEPSS